MTNRRDVLRLAGAMVASGAVLALPTIASATSDTDAAILALVPGLLKAHAEYLAALDDFGRAEDRVADAMKGLRRPDRPNDPPPSAWPNGVPIIAGAPLPTGTEEEWADYHAAEKTFEGAKAKAVREAGREEASRAVDDGCDRVFELAERILSIPAKTMAGCGSSSRSPNTTAISAGMCSTP
jgi:hypothetical protein